MEIVRCPQFKSRALSQNFVESYIFWYSWLSWFWISPFYSDSIKFSGENPRNTESTKNTKDLDHFEESWDFVLFHSNVTFWIEYIRIQHRKLSIIMCFWATKNKISVLKNFDQSTWARPWFTFLANLSPLWFWIFSPIVIRHSNRHLKLNKSTHRFFL